MEGHLQNSPKMGSPTDNDDVKYVSGLSTILVATIQEAKDRISQIEYIFCSQLFPNFQSKSKLLQKIYSEARRAADVEWKEKENEILLQIERLNTEMQQMVEENRCLKLEKERSNKEEGDKMSVLIARLENQQLKVDELELHLRQKSKEVDEGMKLQNKLVQVIQSKSSEIVNKGKQLKEHEEKTNVLLVELGHLETKVDELQVELRQKTEEVVKGYELRENLFKKIESKDLEIMNYEQQWQDQEKEKKILIAKLEHLEENFCEFQKELGAQAEEVEGKRANNHLRQEMYLNGSEMLKQLKDCEKEKKLLLEKINDLEEKVNELQVDLRGRTSEMTKGMDLYQKSLEQIRSKTSEILAEKKKRRDVIDAYKRLKSQYNFLCAKFGVTRESMLTQHKVQDEPDSLRHKQNEITSPDLEDKNEYTSVTACGTNKVRNEITVDNGFEDVKGETPPQSASSLSPIRTSPLAPNCPSAVKSVPLVGRKRPASCWRETRSHQGQNGPDPHDDFLDTPLENIRGNINKSMREELHDLPVPVSRDKNVDSSDDETQDVTADLIPQKHQMPVPNTGDKGFKFVEPVRKKAERENLKGVECKQCKKFYDAVLCADEGKNSDNTKHNLRCEHHDGVSRHRYRYVPPMTPEGFWNIGFESEM
ncbi:Protein gamma response [Parasponia andersonii]|uniref:Protein gamma response n=1 Tax=Parasponia andersonii TaxID=3476 RepID=A0A2P5BVK9_PARAD|nr:Protein gamma response [Parasponia andersonii]